MHVPYQSLIYREANKHYYRWFHFENWKRAPSDFTHYSVWLCTFLLLFHPPPTTLITLWIFPLPRENPGNVELAWKSRHEEKRSFVDKPNDCQLYTVFFFQRDLVEIKQTFLQKYHKTLYKMIHGDCSGDYKKLLLAVVGMNWRQLYMENNDLPLNVS